MKRALCFWQPSNITKCQILFYQELSVYGASSY